MFFPSGIGENWGTTGMGYLDGVTTVRLRKKAGCRDLGGLLNEVCCHLCDYLEELLFSQSFNKM